MSVHSPWQHRAVRMALATVAGVAASLSLFVALVPSGHEALRARALWGLDAAPDAAFERYRATLDSAFALRFALEAMDSRARIDALPVRTVQGLVVRADSGVAEAYRRRIEETARAELTALGLEAPRHPVAIVVMADPRNSGARYMRAVVLPASAGAPCGIVVRLSSRFTHFAGIANTDRLLGGCAFFAAYGAPGAGMRAWLTRSQLRTSAYLQRPASHGDGVLRNPMEVNAALNDRAVAACRSGRPGSCVRLFDGTADTDPATGLATTQALPRVIPPDGRTVVYNPFSFGSPRNTVTHGLLANLAEHLGPDRFRAVWTSDDAPVTAFAQLTGESIDAWVGSYVATHVSAYRAGAALAPGQWLATITLFGLLMGLLLATIRRRLS